MKTVCFLVLLTTASSCFAQVLIEGEPAPARADTLRGMLSPARTCYDVLCYDLSVKVYPDSQFIEGVVNIMFKAMDDFKTMQVDLFSNMNINGISLNGAPATFQREYNAVFVNAGRVVSRESGNILKIEYSGKPQTAKRPPWDGGFVWDKYPNGDPWIGVACEGTGASLWWPNKDHLSDEPDSMMIHLIVPDTLVAVSNGRLIGEYNVAAGWKQFDWHVSYPINNYNVTLYIAKYVHFSDTYFQDDGSMLSLDYYVLPGNLERAKKQFTQVKPMMRCFERYFGKFPFIRDGYKLVEAPYLGMEHQSAIAYGNGYMTGYAGMDYSRIGLDFDYIIIHESGHEWWGNAVSCRDIADLWIHEGFCTYSEALYVECLHGYDTALAYINAKKPYVENIEPIIGTYNINREGSVDMYNKGMLMLNTLRNVIANDSLWFNIIRGIIEHFSYKTVSSDEIETFIANKAGMDLDYFFDQYLRHARLPVLEYSRKKKLVRYRWVADVKDFRMPVKATVSRDVFSWIYPAAEWQELTVSLKKRQTFQIAEDLFYVEVREVE